MEPWSVVEARIRAENPSLTPSEWAYLRQQYFEQAAVEYGMDDDQRAYYADHFIGPSYQAQQQVDETKNAFAEYVPWVTDYVEAAKEQTREEAPQPLEPIRPEPEPPKPITVAEEGWTSGRSFESPIPWIPGAPNPINRALTYMVGGGAENVADTIEAARTAAEEAVVFPKQLMGKALESGLGMLPESVVPEVVRDVAAGLQERGAYQQEPEPVRALRDLGRDLQASAERRKSTEVVQNEKGEWEPAHPVGSMKDVVSDPVHAGLTFVEQFGPTAAMIVPGLLTGLATGSKQAGSAVATAVESLGEAGAALTRAREEGTDEAEARKQMLNVLGANVAILGPSNALEVGLLFSPLGRIPGFRQVSQSMSRLPWVKALTAGAVKSFVESAIEGQQEVIQERIPEWAKDPDLRMQTMKNLFALGAKTPNEKQVQLMARLLGWVGGSAAGVAEVPMRAQQYQVEQGIKKLVQESVAAKEQPAGAGPWRYARGGMIAPEGAGPTLHESHVAAAEDAAPWLSDEQRQAWAAAKPEERQSIEQDILDNLPDEAGLTTEEAQAKLAEAARKARLAYNQGLRRPVEGLEEFIPALETDETNEGTALRGYLKAVDDKIAEVGRSTRLTPEQKAAEISKLQEQRSRVHHVQPINPVDRAVAAWAPSIGRKVVFVDSPLSALGSASRMSGVVVLQRGLPLRENVKQIFAHELMHDMPLELKTPLIQEIQRLLPQQWAKQEQWNRDTYASEYPDTPLDPATLEDETFSRIAQIHGEDLLQAVGEHLGDVEAQKRPIIRRIYEWIHDKFGDLVNGLGLRRPGGDRYSDVRQAREILSRGIERLAEFPAETATGAENEARPAISEETIRRTQPAERAKTMAKIKTMNWPNAPQTFDELVALAQQQSELDMIEIDNGNTGPHSPDIQRFGVDRLANYLAYPERLLSAITRRAKRGVTTPGEVTAKVASTSQEAKDRGSRPAFAGQRALGADASAAIRMEQEGRTREEIRSATGWWHEPDGWKFEVDDSKMRITLPPLRNYADLRKYFNENVTQLGDILDHPQLFAAYPRLAQVPVKLASLETKASTFSNGRINLSPWSFGSEQLPRSISHEIQHAIQRAEGFERGTMPAHARTSNRAVYMTELENIAQETGDIFDADSKAAFRAYLLQPGEVEARAVEHRLRMTPEERAATAPWETREGLVEAGKRGEARFALSDAEARFRNDTSVTGRRGMTFVRAIRAAQKSGDVKRVDALWKKLGQTMATTAKPKTMFALASSVGAPTGEEAKAKSAWERLGVRSPYFRKWSRRAPVLREWGPEFVNLGTVNERHIAEVNEVLGRYKSELDPIYNKIRDELTKIRTRQSNEVKKLQDELDASGTTGYQRFSALEPIWIRHEQELIDIGKIHDSILNPIIERQKAELTPIYSRHKSEIQSLIKPSKKVGVKTGTPVVVEGFHGTGNFEGVDFNPSLLGSTTGAPSAENGFFFSARIETAKTYSDFASGVEQVKGTVLRCLIRLSNPLVYDFSGETYREESYYDIIKRAKKLGHDGVVFLNTFDSASQEEILDHVVVAFEPEQIVIESLPSVPRVEPDTAAEIPTIPGTEPRPALRDSTGQVYGQYGQIQAGTWRIIRDWMQRKGWNQYGNFKPLQRDIAGLDVPTQLDLALALGNMTQRLADRIRHIDLQERRILKEEERLARSERKPQKEVHDALEELLVAAHAQEYNDHIFQAGWQRRMDLLASKRKRLDAKIKKQESLRNAATEDEHIEDYERKLYFLGVESQKLDQDIAEHVADRSSWDPEGETPGTGKGRTNSWAVAKIAELERAGWITVTRPSSDMRTWTYGGKLGPMAKIAWNIGEYRLGMMSESGMMESTDVDRLRKAYTHYVTFQGEEEIVPKTARQKIIGWMQEEGAVKGGSGIGVEVRGRLTRAGTGRFTPPSNVLAHMVNDTCGIASKVEKLNALKPLLELVTSFPDAKTSDGKVLWEIIKPPRRPYYDEESGMIKYRTDPQIERAPDVIAVWDKGTKYLVRFNHPAAMSVLKNLGPSYTPAFLRAVGVLTRVYSSFLTARNPEFIFPNLLADLQTAGLNVTAQDLKWPRIKILKMLPQIYKAVYRIRRAEGRGEEVTAQNDTERYYLEARKHGGMISFLGLESIEDQVEKLAKAMREQSVGSKIWAKSMIPFTWFEDVTAMTEAGPRLGLYVILRQAGVDEVHAAEASRRITVDFSQRGEWARYFAPLYLFANAGIQGNAIMLRNIAKSHKLKGLVSGIAVFGYMYSNYLRHRMGRDDDEGNDKVDNIPTSVWERSIPFNISEDKLFRLRLAWGYNLPFYLGHLAEQYVNGNKGAEEAALDFASAFAAAFNPLGQVDMSGDTVKGIIQLLTPWPARLPLDIAFNRNTFGTKIKPEPFTKETVPDHEMYWAKTPSAYKNIAEWVSELTNDRNLPAGRLDWSPESIKYCFDFATPGLLQMASTGIPSIIKAIQGEPLAARDIPVMRRMMYDLPDWLVSDRFYGNLEMAQARAERWKELKDRDKTAGTNEADEYLKKYRRLLQLVADYEKSGGMKDRMRQMKQSKNEAGRIRLQKQWNRDFWIAQDADNQAYYRR